MGRHAREGGLDLASRPFWSEKIFSGDKGDGGEERSSCLLRVYYVPGVLHISHLMYTATPTGYHVALFEREDEAQMS